MRKYLLVILVVLIYSCSTTKASVNKPLYEVLVVNNDGGANIKFYEILSEPKEIKMLLGDETLAKLIKEKDVAASSFLVLNTGPTKEPYNRMKIERIVENDNQIEVYLKDTQKNLEQTQIDDTAKYPYTVVKINSKKPIVIK
ncbi:protease complex subunit PrcB family protein [Flavobacterium sp.]